MPFSQGGGTEWLSRQPIVPPQPNPRRKLARVIFDSSIGALPYVGPALVRLWQLTHPPKSEQEREAWQGTISERTNEHGTRLDLHEAILFPHENVTGVAAKLVVALARDCPDGLGRRRYDAAELGRLVPNTMAQDLKDAAFELQRLQVARITTALGGA